MTVNGKIVEYEPVALLDYLQREGYNPSHVVIERNMEIITRERFGEITLERDDEINILRFMGGG
ncbi:MAG: sulfur carrier protein ThiS [Oscillospiraceae bacterium]|nr:sulfur carrier protein ThiS [Oscillospiraceae bacterium]